MAAGGVRQRGEHQAECAAVQGHRNLSKVDRSAVGEAYGHPEYRQPLRRLPPAPAPAARVASSSLPRAPPIDAA